MELWDRDIWPVIHSWLNEHGVAIGAITIGALIVLRFGRRLIERLIRRTIAHRTFDNMEAERQREDTVVRVFNGAFTILVLFVASNMVLSDLGVPISPLLAAAGVAGVALGFGGQYLIRDVIAGSFIVFENQYRVNDVVCLDDTCGVVEDITLRMTTLRDLDGVVHHVPNGVPDRISNLTKTFANVNLDVGVDYSSDIDHVIAVVNQVGKDMVKDKDWKKHIIEEPQFERVDDFGDSAIVIKILGRTKPAMQWAVTGELRKRLKVAFDKEGIVIPFPQRVIHQPK